MMTAIERLRRDLGWSQGELSKRSGVGRVTICHAETRKRIPSVPTLARLAEALNVAPRILLADFAPDSEHAS